MSRDRKRIGQLAGLEITADRSVLAGAAALVLSLTFVASRIFRLKPGEAVAGGVLATALHFLSELWHQAGHAHAARNNGYPMEGVDLYAVLGSSRYPVDEPELTSQIHIQRALGGPRASGLLAGVAGLVALLIRPQRTLSSFLSLFLAADNLLVFTLGALTPMPGLETDGDTVLRELRRQRPHNIVLQE